MNETVTVVFAANNSHAILLGVALCSLFENKKGDYPVTIYVLDGGLSAENKARLKVLEDRYQFSIRYLVPNPKRFEGISTESRPIPAYYRVSLASLLPADCHRAIYLDCDLIIRHDIAELFHLDLQGKTAGVVRNLPNDWWFDRFAAMVRQAGIPIPPDAFYFNSGMMLIDLDRWRRLDIENRLFNFIHVNPDKLWVADQDPLNFILLGDVAEVPAKYNLVPMPDYLALKVADPFIIHFAGGIKPWYLLSALPYQPEYLKYVAKTPWKNRKYRKLVDVWFAQKYHFYKPAWWLWQHYKAVRSKLRRPSQYHAS